MGFEETAVLIFFSPCGNKDRSYQSIVGGGLQLLL